MDDKVKEQNALLWNTLKPDLEHLAGQLNALYAALGSTRTCKQVNELWQPEKPAIGIGFVPPEVLQKLETLITASGIELVKGNGPLGKGVYFSFASAKLSGERLRFLASSVEKELATLREAAAAAAPQPEAAPAEQAEQEKEPEPTTPHAAAFVDAFNRATDALTPAQSVDCLINAIPRMNLPELYRRELLKTLEVMRTPAAE